MYICIYVYMQICMCIYIYVCVCKYIYILYYPKKLYCIIYIYISADPVRDKGKRAREDCSTRRQQLPSSSSSSRLVSLISSLRSLCCTEGAPVVPLSQQQQWQQQWGWPAKA